MSEKDINTEILVRLARIEENTKGFDRISEKADIAYSTSLQNKQEIADIKANNKWAWGFIISLALTIVGYFLTRGGG